MSKEYHNEIEVADIMGDVRIALDMNMSSEALVTEQDVDTLTLEEIIESKIEAAARIVELTASAHLLGPTTPFGKSVGWHTRVGNGSGYIQLPDDFLRLVTFQMSDWRKAVTTPITEDNALYLQQSSRYPGIKGNPQKPVVAVVHDADGLLLEFYSCTGGKDVYVKKAEYMPIPKIKEGRIRLSEKLVQAVVYQTASLVAQSVGNDAVAEKMQELSNALKQ